MTLENTKARLPLEIEDIDAGWLTWALSGYLPGVEVNDFEIVDVRHGFTTLVRLRLDLNDAGKEAGIGPTVMVKGGFEEFTRGKARAYAIKGYALEVVGYRDVWPSLGLNVPTCYFADMQLDVEPERQQTILIMEDLVTRSVRFCHGLEPQTFEQVQRRLSAIAGLHAKTWGSPEIEDGGRFAVVGKNGQKMFRDYMTHAGYEEPETWQKYIDMPRAAACSNRHHDLDWMIRALDHMAAVSEQLPSVIVHGDLHLGNLYEDADGTPGFLDALPRREPAMAEVMYHIGCALDPADRRDWDEALVAHYRDELAGHGVDVPSLDELMYQYALYLPYGYVTFIVNESHYQTESFNTAHAARFDAAMVDHGTRALIDAAAKH